MKRKLTGVVVCVILILFLLLHFTVSIAADTAKVTVETARLRDEASENSKVLELISQDEEVEILSQNGDWYQVKYKGITGYLRGDLIDVSNNSNNENINSAENTQTNITNNEVTDTNTNQNNNENVTENEENTISNNTNSANENSSVETNQISNNQDSESEKNSVYVTKDIVNLKIVPLINSLDITTLKAGTQVSVLDTINEWVNVSNNEVQGWVRSEQLKEQEQVQEQPKEEQKNEVTTEQEQVSNEKNEDNKAETTSKTMYVNSQTVNVRSKADKSSQIVMQLSINTSVEVLSEENGWSYIKANGKEGYIATTLLSTNKQESSRGTTVSRTENTQESSKNEENASSEDKTNSNNNNTSSSTKGAEVVSYAMSLIGKPYVYGGSTPSGFDCSGFTSYVYKHFGVSINRTAAAQSSNGKSVSRSELQPGDLIMFCKPINHVGIYIGNGKIVHAANPSRGVTTDTILSGYYNTNYNCARRIF